MQPFILWKHQHTETVNTDSCRPRPQINDALLENRPSLLRPPLRSPASLCAFYASAAPRRVTEKGRNPPNNRRGSDRGLTGVLPCFSGWMEQREGRGCCCCCCWAADADEDEDEDEGRIGLAQLNTYTGAAASCCVQGPVVHSRFRGSERSSGIQENQRKERAASEWKITWLSAVGSLMQGRSQDVRNTGASVPLQSTPHQMFTTNKKVFLNYLDYINKMFN